MTLGEAKKQLENEGFTHFKEFEGPPGKQYPEYRYETIVAYLVLRGEMMLTVGEIPHLLKEGSRYDVPSHDRHSIRIGMSGCTYLAAH